MTPTKQLPQLADLVPDPGPRGIVSPNVTGAGMVPSLNVEAFVAPAEGMRRAGAQIEQTGGALASLRIKQLQALGVKHESEADGIMKQAEDAMQVEMINEHDETKWKSIAEKHIAKANDAIGSIPMSKLTSEAVRMKADRWGIHRSGAVEILSARSSISKAASITGDGVKLAIVNGDPEKVRAAQVERDAVTGSNPNLNELELKEAERVQKDILIKSTSNVIRASMDADPWATLEKVKAGGFPGLDENQTAAAVVQVEQEIAHRQREGEQSIRDRIATLATGPAAQETMMYGAITDESIQAEAELSHLGAEDVAQLIEMKNKVVKAAIGNKPINNDEIAAIHGEISLYNSKGEDDPGAKKWGALLNKAIIATSGSDDESSMTQGVLKSMLYQKHPFLPRRSTEDIPDDIEKTVDAAVGLMASQGSWGIPFTKDSDGRVRTNMKANYDKVVAHRILLRDLRRDMKENPDDWKSFDHINKWLFGDPTNMGKYPGKLNVYRGASEVNRRFNTVPVAPSGKPQHSGGNEPYISEDYREPELPSEDDISLLPPPDSIPPLSDN